MVISVYTFFDGPCSSLLLMLPGDGTKAGLGVTLVLKKRSFVDAVYEVFFFYGQALHDTGHTFSAGTSGELLGLVVDCVCSSSVPCVSSENAYVPVPCVRMYVPVPYEVHSRLSAQYRAHVSPSYLRDQPYWIRDFSTIHHRFDRRSARK